jgi:hypothetical protein
MNRKKWRVGVYLTNSLEEGEKVSQDLFAQWLANEAREASNIKRQMPIMCVLGNPPYSGESANKGDWIMDLMGAYKKEPGSTAILNGVTALTPTAGGGVGAFAGDVAKLVGAIHASGGGSSIVLFAAPPQAAAASILAGPGLNLPVIVAPSLAAGTVVAVEAQAFASGFSDAPRLEVGREAALHFEDVAPQHLSAVGSPNNTVAAPIRSALQNDLVALRMILRVAFGMRAPGMVQHITGATY